MTDRYKKNRIDLSHEIWAATQLAPGEGIADGVARIETLLRRAIHSAITHCDKCGCSWLDDGVNPIGCPYCEHVDWRAVNTELLPPPPGEASSFGNYEVHDNEVMAAYARANIARAVAPLQAEIEALQAEVDVLKAENARLAKALLRYGEHDESCSAWDIPICTCGLDAELEQDVPNATTKKAIAELEAGKGKKFTSVDDLMADLHADD